MVIKQCIQGKEEFMIMPQESKEQGSESPISSQVGVGSGGHIRLLSAVPVDLEKLLQEIEAEEKKEI